MKKSLKVCMIIDGWTPIYGGGQKHVLETAKRLTKNYACEIDLYVRSLKDEQGKKSKKNENYGKFKIFRVGPCTKFFNIFGRILWLMYVVPFMIKNHILNPYDVIHSHAFLAAIPAKILSFFIRRPVIYTVHGTSLFIPKKTIFAYLENKLLCQFKYDQEITVAKNFLNLPNRNKNIVVIPNGVDVKKFDRIKEKKSKKFKVIYVGRFDKIKGIDELISAIELIKKTNIEVYLIGSGDEEMKIKERIEKAKLKNHIKLRGCIKGNALIKEYKSSQLFVLPSLSEGQPLTLLEAWAAKLPVLVTKVGDNEEFVKEGENGHLVDPGNSEQLAKKLNMINDLYIKNPKKLEKMGENGYELVRKNFTWEKTTQKIFDQYQKIIKRRKK